MVFLRVAVLHRFYFTQQDGEIVTSKVDSDVSQLQDLTYGGDKTFSITFIKGVGSPFDVGRYAIKSDEKLGDINKVIYYVVD